MTYVMSHKYVSKNIQCNNVKKYAKCHCTHAYTIYHDTNYTKVSMFTVEICCFPCILVTII